MASFLVKAETKDKMLFIFHEPTTDLHFHDIKKLLKSFEALIEIGHSVIVVENNFDLIKCANFVYDLDPEGGEKVKNIEAGRSKKVDKNKKITLIYKRINFREKKGL